jgi:hypothetical protein
MRRKPHALSDGPCLSINMPKPLVAALAMAAERRATTMSGYIRSATLEALQKDGVTIEPEMEVRTGPALAVGQAVERNMAAGEAASSARV